MIPGDKITLQYVNVQVQLAMVEMDRGDLLRARERLALIVKELDEVCYGE